MQTIARRTLAWLRLVNGRWAAILVPLVGVAMFAYHRSLNPALWALAVYVVFPFLMLKLLLEQLAGRSGDRRDPGKALGRGVRAFLVVMGTLSFFSLGSLLHERDGFGFVGMSVLLMGPMLLAVGIRGRAYGQLGRAAGRRRRAAPTAG